MDTNELIAELTSIAERINNLKLAIEGKPVADVETAESKIARGVCTYCGKPIGDKQAHRGAHQNCYKTARRRIEKGKTTDNELVANGFLLPPGAPGPKVSIDDPVEQLRIKRLIEKDDPTRSSVGGRKRARKPKESDG